jgi:hypothetical protein
MLIRWDSFEFRYKIWWLLANVSTGLTKQSRVEAAKERLLRSYVRLYQPFNLKNERGCTNFPSRPKIKARRNDEPQHMRDHNYKIFQFVLIKLVLSSRYIMPLCVWPRYRNGNHVVWFGQSHFSKESRVHIWRLFPAEFVRKQTILCSSGSFRIFLKTVRQAYYCYEMIAVYFHWIWYTHETNWNALKRNI